MIDMQAIDMRIREIVGMMLLGSESPAEIAEMHNLSADRSRAMRPKLPQRAPRGRERAGVWPDRYEEERRERMDAIMAECAQRTTEKIAEVFKASPFWVAVVRRRARAAGIREVE